MIDWPPEYKPFGCHSPIRETWGAVAVGVGTAIAGAYAGNRSASAAKKLGKNAGKVDIYHESSPWGPSVGPRTDLMNRATALGMRDQPTFGSWLGGQGGSLPAGGGGGGGRRSRRGGRRGGGGGAGAGGGAAAFTGVSPETSQVRQAMIDEAQAGNPLYGEAENFISDTLAGDDRNAYRGETFGALRDVNDPDLQRYKDLLFAELSGQGGGFGGSSRGGGGGGSFVASSGGGGGEGPVGAAAYIRKMLEEQYGENPFLDQSIQDALDDQQRAFASTVIPGLNSEYAGSGMFGSGMYSRALAETGEAQARGLAKESNARRAADYNDWQARRMAALGYGTEMDINAADNAASARAAGAGAGAQQAALDLQRQQMLLGALGGAVGEGVGLREFGLGGMGDLAKSFSSDQQFALGGVPDITGLSLRDWGAAGGLSLGADQNQNQYTLGMKDIQARAGAARAAQSLANKQFMFDVFRDERNSPLALTGGAADIVNAMTGGYGTQYEHGLDARSQSPYTGSVGGQTMSGALGGALAGMQLYGMYRGGGGAGGGGTGGGYGYGYYPEAGP